MNENFRLNSAPPVLIEMVGRSLDPGQRAKGWRSPKRFAGFLGRGARASVLDCGGPPPLFHWNNDHE
jgi:hypothetical protein